MYARQANRKLHLTAPGPLARAVLARWYRDSRVPQVSGNALARQNMLFHISEEANINRFEPRPSEYTSEPVVWAIDDAHLRNYLVPRDCPRVTYYAGPQTSDADREILLARGSAVVAIEQRWMERIEQCRLYCYSLPDQTFECLDEGAGYFVSRGAVVPTGVEVLPDPVSELRRRGVELRVLPNLWPLRDVVIASSLQFSIIRMRNALPRGTS